MYTMWWINYHATYYFWFIWSFISKCTKIVMIEIPVKVFCSIHNMECNKITDKKIICFQQYLLSYSFETNLFVRIKWFDMMFAHISNSQVTNVNYGNEISKLCSGCKLHKKMLSYLLYYGSVFISFLFNNVQ